MRSWPIALAQTWIIGPPQLATALAVIQVEARTPSRLDNFCGGTVFNFVDQGSSRKVTGKASP
jgi:hypothetical protein